MNKNPMKNIFLLCSVLTLATSNLRASNLSIYDDSFRLFNGSTQVTGRVITAVWGTYAGGAFVPNQTVYANGGFGYVDVSNPALPELQVIINRVDATQYASGTQMALAIFNQPDLSNWNSSSARAVLTDTSWIAPAWSLVGNDKDVFFTAATTALEGTFTYSSGGQDSIVMIPEPTTTSLALLSMVGALALRRRK